MRATLEWARQRRAYVSAVAGAIVLLSAALLYLGLRSADDPKAAEPATGATATATPDSTPTSTPPVSPTPVRWASILNGAPLTEEEWNARKDLLPIAVMLDNTPNAVPHVGIAKADLVYEAFVEGGITRLMAVYWSQEADLIEPVRSARTPFVIWVDELGAMYGHAGAADTDNEADAVGQIFAWSILDLNAFTPGPSTAYFRDSERQGPYNLATSTQRLREAAERLGYTQPPAIEPWKFKSDGEGTEGLPVAGGVQISFQERPSPWQTVQWRWDEASKSYLRSQFGGPFIDGASNEQVRARNVIVMRMPWRVVDESAHVLLEQIGTGEAIVYLDGHEVAATWEKADRKARTRFLNAAGKEIAFNRGPIWIEVVGPASQILVMEDAGDLAELPPYVPPPPDQATERPEDEPTAATPMTTETPSPTATPTAGATSSPAPTPAASVTGTVRPTTSTPSAAPEASSTSQMGTPLATSAP